MAKPEVKVDLTVLKKLVGELESTLNTAYAIASAANPDNAERVVELSKAAGLCAGIMQESSLLVLDIHAVVRGTQPPVDEGDLLSKILGSIKPGSQN